MRGAAGAHYCSEKCAKGAVVGDRGFCADCIAQTVNYSAPSLVRINWQGPRWVDTDQVCPKCGSALSRLSGSNQIDSTRRDNELYRVIQVIRNAYRTRLLMCNYV